MYLLGIESSCDETGVAVLHSERREEGLCTHTFLRQSNRNCVESVAGNFHHKLLANVLCSSAQQHAITNGIVPEVAARDHSRQLYSLVIAALSQANIHVSQLTAIGYTRGPGLIGSLMVGCGFAKSLGFALGIPTIGVHHLEGHICAVFADDASDTKQIGYPFIAMLISGAHSHIFLVERPFRYTLLGATRDDAAGEAFDKCATMLGLGYPGGAALSALACKGDPARFHFPRPMLDKPGLDMSFSGLKTAVRYQLQKLTAQTCQQKLLGHNGEMLQKTRQDRATTVSSQKSYADGLAQQTRADVAAGVEIAIVQTLIEKLDRAVKTTGVDNILIAGGVCANRCLRHAASAKWGKQLHIPSEQLCTDNGAIIALAAQQRLIHGISDDDNTIDPLPRWSLAI